MPFTVLLADDDTNIQQVIEMFLMTQGCQVVCVSDGSACLAQLENKPDLILMDINMPKMGGIDALAAIRAHQHAANVPVIAMSGTTEAEAEIRAKNYAKVTFLQKPFGLSDLQSRVAEAMAGGGASRRAAG